MKDWTLNGGALLKVGIVATKLGNDSSVNTSESMAALRHNSVAARKHYNKTSGISETCKHKALGIIKK